MRRFRSADGRDWTAALWCGSYGEVMLIFSRSGSTELFHVMLEAESQAAGETLLASLDEADLVRRLADAEPWVT